MQAEKTKERPGQPRDSLYGPIKETMVSAAGRYRRQLLPHRCCSGLWDGKHTLLQTAPPGVNSLEETYTICGVSR